AIVWSLAASVNSLAQTTQFLNKPVTAWTKDLADNRAPVRRSAAFALGRIGEEAILGFPSLIRLVRKDRDAGVREMAAAAIGDIVRALPGGGRGLWSEAGAALSET